MSNIDRATAHAISPLRPLEFDRPPLGPHDVCIPVKYCGVRHSDVHQARGEWGGIFDTNFPCMPGHEIAGVVTEGGDQVQLHHIGDRVGVGCMVSRGGPHVPSEQQYQDPIAVMTFKAKDSRTGQVTFGGYSDEVVVDEHFVLRIPDEIPLEQAAPLLCAGVTTWSPSKHWGVGSGKTVGIRHRGSETRGHAAGEGPRCRRDRSCFARRRKH